jgi:Ca2+-binding EF-hand superfamily protein
VIENPIFEGVFAAFIISKTIVMSFESQWKGMMTGHKIGYFGYDTPAQDSWIGAESAWPVLEVFFGVVFSVELILKFVGLRKDFFYDYWNYLDSFIVLAWLADTIVSHSAGTSGIEIPNMTFIRLMRLVRLLRLLRLVKRIQAFDSLYLMTTAMMGSMSVLAWTVVMLVLVQMLIAMMLQQFCQPFIVDTLNPIEARHEVFLYYGSFARSMLTMFELTLGNWMPPCRALVENISEWYMLIILAHKLIIGFSCVGVITGVFIQETFKVATTDDKIMLMQKERAVRTHTKKMKALFAYADQDGSGELDREEWKAVVEQPEVKTWLSAMELDVRDADNIFSLIDDGDESMTAEELVKGIGRLKGAARSIDVCTMLHEFRKQNNLMLEFYKNARSSIVA